MNLVVDMLYYYAKYPVIDGHVDCEYGLLPVEEAMEKFSNDGYYCYLSEEDDDFEW